MTRAFMANKPKEREHMQKTTGVYGAFILYPGTEDEIFYLDEEPSHRDLLYGVGAFKLGPGRKSDFTHIRYYVEKLLKLYRKKEKE